MGQCASRNETQNRNDRTDQQVNLPSGVPFVEHIDVQRQRRDQKGDYCKEMNVRSAAESVKKNRKLLGTGKTSYDFIASTQIENESYMGNL